MINIQKQLIEKGAYELIPLIESLLLKYKFVLISYSSLTNAEKNLRDKMNAIKAEKNLELEANGVTTWGVNDRNRWNIDIEGFNIDIVDYVNKNVWELLHYARLCIEMFPQIINVAIFDYGERISRNDISIKRFIDVVPDDYREYKNLLQTIADGECFKYISSADNYLKHIDDISVKLRTKDLMSEFDSFIVAGFEFRKNYYDSRVVSEMAEDIKDFVVGSVKSLIKLLLSYNIKTKDKNNYITDVSYEAVLNGKTLEYLAYFIDVPEDCYTLSTYFGDEFIYVRPITVDKNYKMYDDSDFNFEVVFIRNKDTHNILGKAEICDLKDASYYKKYHIKTCNNKDFVSYKHNFKDNYRHIVVKNMLAYNVIERRIL